MRGWHDMNMLCQNHEVQIAKSVPPPGDIGRSESLDSRSLARFQAIAAHEVAALVPERGSARCIVQPDQTNGVAMQAISG
eukprot:CAMPEP_0203862006 /NCGR_PEP_ID=MMETSP0359-20131031/13344_1 /ASSEMBLY_ACC=CAM_ASM_000338 /TAXON_ID=268821 /ORGANISM="Scrippsiella Hangoei, Strain SHTV-5" /LENGTH=79 /DNA_ID=CAMNT_0050779335 /DNA_START=167 /DNA_END=404 /DNA_ORIENTATION=+